MNEFEDCEKQTKNLAFIQMAEMAFYYHQQGKRPIQQWKEKKIKYFNKQRLRLHKQILGLQFLIKCRENQLIPKFLRVKRKQTRHNKTITELEIMLLHKEISFLRAKLDHIEKDVYFLYLEMSTAIPKLKFDHSMHTLELICKSEIQIIKKRHEQKIIWWQNKIKKKCDVIRNEVQNNTENFGYVNLSHRPINFEEHEAMRYGPKHIWSTKPRIIDTIPEIENLLKVANPENVQYLKKQYCKSMVKWRNEKEVVNTRENNKKIQALRNLKKDETITIITADKTSKLVILDTPSYKEKIQKVLQKLKVNKLKEDPTKDIVRRLSNLGKLKYIPENLKKACTIPDLPTIPRMFLQIKLHKEGHPLRALVTKTNTVTQNLEKEMSKITKPLIEGSKFTIKNSLEAKQKIENVSNLIKENTTLYSMDVEALYPSINMPKVKRLIIKKLEENKNYTPKQIKTIEIAINLIKESNYFKIEEQFYQQEQGAPIGSNFSPDAAEIEMQNLENTIFRNNKYPYLILYLRYVDDCLIIWNGTDEEFKAFLQTFNNFSTNINFTCEKEEQKELPFLDLLLKRKEDHIEISIHRKPSSNQIPIHSSSCHPQQHKMASFFTNLYRANRLTTCKENKDNEVQYINELFIQAGYKQALFNKIKKKVEMKTNPPSKLTPIKEDGNNKTKRYVETTYYPQLDDWYSKLKSNLKDEIILSFKTPPKVQNICKRDRDKEEPKTGIYYIPIQNNETKEKKYYIGQSKRFLDIRKKEHKESLNIIPPKTKLAEFMQNNNAHICWNDIGILKKPCSAKHLLISEEIEILLHNKFVINDKPSDLIDQTWSKEIYKNRTEYLKNSKIYRELYNNIYTTQESNLQIKITKELGLAIQDQKENNAAYQIMPPQITRGSHQNSQIENSDNSANIVPPGHATRGSHQNSQTENFDNSANIILPGLATRGSQKKQPGVNC